MTTKLISFRVPVPEHSDLSNEAYDAQSDLSPYIAKIVSERHKKPAAGNSLMNTEDMAKLLLDNIELNRKVDTLNKEKDKNENDAAAQISEMQSKIETMEKQQQTATANEEKNRQELNNQLEEAQLKITELEKHNDSVALKLDASDKWLVQATADHQQQKESILKELEDQRSELQRTISELNAAHEESMSLEKKIESLIEESQFLRSIIRAHIEKLLTYKRANFTRLKSMIPKLERFIEQSFPSEDDAVNKNIFIGYLLGLKEDIHEISRTLENDLSSIGALVTLSSMALISNKDDLWP